LLYKRLLKRIFILSTGGNNDKDVSLNAVGFQQAKDIALVFRNLPIRSICFSPLKRAKETKEVISKNIQANHYEIPELGECSLQVWDDMTACGANAYHSSHEHVKTFMQKVLSGINQALLKWEIKTTISICYFTTSPFVVLLSLSCYVA